MQSMRRCILLSALTLLFVGCQKETYKEDYRTNITDEDRRQIEKIIQTRLPSTAKVVCFWKIVSPEESINFRIDIPTEDLNVINRDMPVKWREMKGADEEKDDETSSPVAFPSTRKEWDPGSKPRLKMGYEELEGGKTILVGLDRGAKESRIYVTYSASEPVE